MICRDPRSGLDYRRYALQRGDTGYFVEGLAAYGDALRLALASVVLDLPVDGEIKVATTEVTDAAAFARLQAGLLDPRGVRGEGYLRNNSMFAYGATDRARTSANYREIMDAMWLFNEKFERALAEYDKVKPR